MPEAWFSREQGELLVGLALVFLFVFSVLMRRLKRKKVHTLVCGNEYDFPGSDYPAKLRIDELDNDYLDAWATAIIDVKGAKSVQISRFPSGNDYLYQSDFMITYELGGTVKTMTFEGGVRIDECPINIDEINVRII